MSPEDTYPSYQQPHRHKSASEQELFVGCQPRAGFMDEAAKWGPEAPGFCSLGDLG